ncbi:RHS repeat-associated core domain-containing protein, partial [Pseudomonas sp. NFACC02]|uniref:RHS repeat-associated core domain-containing protein n=1 Tax=Pseudomonas sp. NFACC02 TaxID=1566250 RepID=UPI0008C8857B
YFANQQVEPLRTFAYDTLYQLIEATGYEAKTLSRGPGNDAFRTFAQADELGGYTQRYDYDAGGNLQTLVHVGVQNFTRRFATASTSNRSVLQTADQPPSEEQIVANFDPNGNLRTLQAGQDLAWDFRNQLSEVTPVERESGINDSEVYRYDAAGMRVRKVRITQAKTVAHHNEVRYLPSLEIRTNTATGEVLHVVTATAGRSDVRVLHWQAGKPETLENDQVRYSLSDHLGSSTLELDAKAQLLSQEIYYPYGETAWFAGRSEVEVSYKTIRYSGKERDATGLYYYGLRYYAPWLMRWINPDPAGHVDGPNLYRMVRNSPVTLVDDLGRKPTVPNEIHYIWLGKDPPVSYVKNVGETARLNPDYKVILHLDLVKGVDASWMKNALKKQANANVSVLREESFFKEFERTASYKIYSNLYGSDKRNYAAASDVLRYSLINHYGGVYSDMDDHFEKGLKPKIFSSKPGRVYTLHPVRPPWAPSEMLVPNSSFAAHADNKNLTLLIKTVESRAEKYMERGLGETFLAQEDWKGRMQFVSEVTGPKVFTDVLTHQSPGYKNLIADIKRTGGKTFTDEGKKRMPLHNFIEIGSGHSWR